MLRGSPDHGYCPYTNGHVKLSSLDGEILTKPAVRRTLADVILRISFAQATARARRSFSRWSLNKTLAVKSCTGGPTFLLQGLQHLEVFHGGAVCYHNDAKVQMLEVPESMLAQHGAVGEEVAIGGGGSNEKLGADYGSAQVAGPQPNSSSSSARSI